MASIATVNRPATPRPTHHVVGAVQGLSDPGRLTECCSRVRRSGGYPAVLRSWIATTRYPDQSKMSSAYRCGRGRLINRIKSSRQPDQHEGHPTMIHTIQPDTYLRHHSQQTTRIVERYQRRRTAISRTLPGPRTISTASA